jgi:hypothetical protein
MYASLRWICGACALALLALAFWMLRAEPSVRPATLAGVAVEVPLRWGALWTAQISFLCFAASRTCKSRARGLPPAPWERGVLKAARPALLSVAVMAAVWLVRGLLRG